MERRREEGRKGGCEEVKGRKGEGGRRVGGRRGRKDEKGREGGGGGEGEERREVKNCISLQVS